MKYTFKDLKEDLNHPQPRYVAVITFILTFGVMLAVLT